MGSRITNFGTTILVGLAGAVWLAAQIVTAQGSSGELVTTAPGSAVEEASAAVMIFPTPLGYPITLGSPETFTWSRGVGVTSYDLTIGSTPGGRDLFDAVDGDFTTVLVTLPLDGRTLYVTLWSYIAPSWQAKQYVYTAFGPPLIESQPANLVIWSGRAATFTVGATGPLLENLPGRFQWAPLFFQWQVSPDGGATWVNLANGGVYRGVTTFTLTVGGATVGLSGLRYRCVASNFAGSATSNPAMLTVLRGSTPSDFDSDGKADIALFRPSTGTWWILQSASNDTASLAQPWGTSTDIPVPGDYDGDGKTDVAIFRPSTGTWWISQSSTNDTTYVSQTWGADTDIPVPGDYDSDGKTDVAVFRASTGTWWILKSSTNNTTYVSQTWRANTDIPVPGDYDGDGKIDPAIFRASTGTWWILQSSHNSLTYASQTWGADTDIPVPGDYDGDGKTDVAVFRASTGTWWILQSSTNNTTYVSQTWGLDTDIPVPNRP